MNNYHKAVQLPQPWYYFNPSGLGIALRTSSAAAAASDASTFASVTTRKMALSSFIFMHLNDALELTETVRCWNRHIASC
jgi:hypothetical protein